LLRNPAWQAAQSASGMPGIAVLALYSAQAELIRRLIRQSPALGPAQSALVVDIPTAIRQREFSVVLVSLTRSHTHRAVSYGEGPQALVMAVTRARNQLVFFGDPGTLVRRSQWEGPLDHLDEAAATRESRIIGKLVSYLQGHPGAAQTFSLWEGSGT